jgi:hypothetical protein
VLSRSWWYEKRRKKRRGDGELDSGGVRELEDLFEFFLLEKQLDFEATKRNKNKT